MTAQLTKIKASSAQAVLNWSFGPGQVVIEKIWTALKMGIPLYQSHGWGSRKNIELAGKSAEGMIAPLSCLVVWSKLPDKHPQKALLKQYSQSYEVRFKSEPGAFDGYAHDAFMLVVDSAKKAGADRKVARDHIENQVKKWPAPAACSPCRPKIIAISKKPHLRWLSSKMANECC